MTEPSIVVSSASNVMTAMDIFQQVSSFYEISWNHLIVFSGVALAIVGIIIPVIISYIQNKTIKCTEDAIKFQIAEQNKQLENQRREYLLKLTEQEEVFIQQISEQKKIFADNLQKQEKLFKEQIDIQAKKTHSIDLKFHGINARFWHMNCVQNLQEKPAYSIIYASAAVLSYKEAGEYADIVMFAPAVKNILLNKIKRDDVSGDLKSAIKQIISIFSSVPSNIAEKSSGFLKDLAEIRNFYESVK
ncbi:MAG: hypothetical protein WC234_00880 [Endomicrobiaceae bacterium]